MTSGALKLSELNHSLEEGLCGLPDTLWDEWLWNTDPTEPISADCLLNKMHLLGLLIARHKAKHCQEASLVVPSLLNIIHRDIPIHKMTPRQLRDIVEDLQMHWSMYVKHDFEKVFDTVEGCFVQFGHINNKRSAFFDDISSEDALVAGQMSTVAIRRFITIFFVLYRHLHILNTYVDCENCAERNLYLCNETYQLFGHHVEASLETFYVHQMHAALPPASRLIYRQDFTGFYHCVSQVVYFHYPNYERKKQILLDDMRKGDSPLNIVAPMMQIFPDLDIKYDDDNYSDRKWTWCLVNNTLFLMTPERICLYSPNIFDMVGVWLKHSEEIERKKAEEQKVKSLKDIEPISNFERWKQQKRIY
jgi:hypothetical protein